MAQPTLQLLRVKRRLADGAADQLIVQDPHAGSKRFRPDQLLLMQLAGSLHLGDAEEGEQGAEGDQQPGATAAGEGQEEEGQEEAEQAALPRRRRYLRVRTLRPEELQGRSAEEVRQLIAAWSAPLLTAKQQQQQQQQGPAEAAAPSGAATGAEQRPEGPGAQAATPAEPAAQQAPKFKPPGASRRRQQPQAAAHGLSVAPAQAAEGQQASEPGTAGASVSAQATPAATPIAAAKASGPDVSALKEGRREAARAASVSARSKMYTQVRYRRRQEPQQPQPQPAQLAEAGAEPGTGAEGGDLLPEVFKVLEFDCRTVDEQGGRRGRRQQAAAGAAAAAAPGEQAKLSSFMGMVDEYLGSHQQGSSGAAGATDAAQPSGQPEGEDEEGDAFVYDVYVEVGEDWAGPGFPAPSADEDVPVLEAADSDDEFYWAEREAAGGWGGWDGSDHDSEDSNAESYFANSYPDDEGNSGDDSDGGWGGGDWRVHGRGTTADDEEYDVNDYDSDEEDFGRRGGHRGQAVGESWGQRRRHAALVGGLSAAATAAAGLGLGYAGKGGAGGAQ